MNLPPPVDDDVLQQLASDMIYQLSQDMLGGELDRLEAKSPIEIITYFYLSSDCDVFAEAIASIAGGDVVAINSISQGPIHRLVRLEGGEMVDAGGFQSIETLEARYQLHDLSVAPAAFPAYADEMDVETAIAVMSSLPVEPFPGWRQAARPTP